MLPHLTLERSIAPVFHGESTARHPDRVLAELAALQHSVVGRWQLRTLGFDKGAIERRLASGHLHRVRPGVYAVGHARVSPDGRRMAAVLAGGPGALLSHVSALGLRGLAEREPSRPHVTLPGDLRHHRNDIAWHRATQLTPADVGVVRGVPCTSWGVSLIDFCGAPRSTAQTIERVCDRSCRAGEFDSRVLEDLFDRMRGRRGLGRLRDVLAVRERFAVDLRSRLEVEAWEWIGTLPIVAPEPNVRLRLGELDLVADLLWRAEGVVAELDGRAWHGDLASVRADELRDGAYRGAGLRVERFTWWDVTRDRGRSEHRLLRHF